MRGAGRLSPPLRGLYEFPDPGLRRWRKVLPHDGVEHHRRRARSRSRGNSSGEPVVRAQLVDRRPHRGRAMSRRPRRRANRSSMSGHTNDSRVNRASGREHPMGRCRSRSDRSTIDRRRGREATTRCRARIGRRSRRADRVYRCRRHIDPIAGSSRPTPPISLSESGKPVVSAM